MAQPEFMTMAPIRPAAPKAKMTIYFAMLIIALIAMLVTCIFLYLEVKQSGGFGQVKGGLTAIDRPTVKAVT